MGIPLALAAADDVRALIARLVLGAEDSPIRIGGIELASHQREAVTRIEEAIREFGGALLCDMVGSGKTFIGLAVAARIANPIIIAPAALRDMWKDAIHVTNSTARVLTMETLSRGSPSFLSCDGFIVDEAHHFRNRSSNRHRTLSSLIARRPVLFMTATPVHNSRKDLYNLAGMFLGERAASLSEAELARLIVRRGKERVSLSASIPHVPRTTWIPLSDDPEITNALLALPSPVPLRDAGSADALATTGLVRQWASSERALEAALRRRLSRATAIELSLEAGEYPSATEIQSWIAGDDCVQLGFAGILSSPLIAPTDLKNAVSTHATGLRRVLKRIKTSSSLDDERAAMLLALRARFPNERMVAFASYEATVRALFERLSANDRTALLTARGGVVAGGPVTRDEIVRQFAPGGDAILPSDRIDLLLTTDLLSEGVNLQKASVVVHLDVPWTSARLEQRIGRIARIGSLHSTVHSFGFRPPPSADRILRASALVSAKWLEAALALGEEPEHGPAINNAPHPAAPSETSEAIRALLTKWLRKGSQSSSDTSIAAAARADRSGFIAVLEGRGELILLSGNDDNPASESFEHFLGAAAASGGANYLIESETLDCVMTKIDRWILSRESTRVAGIGPSAFLSSRRRVLAGIDSLAAETPPHARLARLDLLQRARHAATSTQGAAQESSMHLLQKRNSAANNAAWIDEIADLGSNTLGGASENQPYRLRALLLLVGPTPPPAS